ncbi:hypothetical protein [Paracoccus laeviglucosivorans]|uniref:Glycerophosphoryl diester phosphodiesterase membrane domain-containing protein n=1 Tax=Paracoccus laeviglucosivorans TaxID=1197861 RepID=A0A521AU46_9RHOB|nr:hypothetical protein [Paracoccus laeviglucosivorans]SMO38130.1 hypothetical protein SAMN06265221_101348 [Paracoccus laeviglucosivorans]
MAATNPIGTIELLRGILTQPMQRPGALLRIAGAIWLVQFPSFLSAEAVLPTDGLILMGMTPGPLTTAVAVLVALMVYIGTAWAAVGWHRLTIMQEKPGLIAPQPHMGRVLDYFVRGIALSVITWLPILMLAGFAAVVLPPGFLLGPRGAVLIPGAFLAIWLTLRLCPWLVSGAVNDRLSLGESWRTTAPISKALAGLSVLGIIAYAIVVGLLTWAGMSVGDDQGYYISDTAMFGMAVLACAVFFVFFVICISAFNTVYTVARAAPLPSA